MDLSDPIRLREGFDVVIHAAGAKRGGYEFNIASTRNLLEWASQAGVGHLILVSSVGVYGATGKRAVFVEESDQRPRNEYELSKARAEDFAREWCGKHGIALSVLRPSTVLAPAPPTRVPLLQFFRVLQHGHGWLFAGWRSQFNYVHVDDVAEACAEVATAPAGSGIDLILNAPISVGSAVESAELALGQAPSRQRVPWVPLHGVHVLARIASAYGWGPALQLQELTNQAVFSPERANRMLTSPPRPMTSVLPELVRIYGSAGIL